MYLIIFLLAGKLVFGLSGNVQVCSRIVLPSAQQNSTHLTSDRVILLICTAVAPTTTTLIITGTEYTFRRDLFCLRVYSQNRHAGKDTCRSITLKKNACLFFTTSTYRKLMDVYCSDRSRFCDGQRKENTENLITEGPSSNVI